MLRAPEFSEPRRKPRRQSRPGPWLLLFSAALAVRVAFVFLGPAASAAPPPTDRIAASLAADRGFALDARPTALVPPVTPWLASLGMRALNGAPYATRLLASVIGALVPLLVAGLGAMMFGAGIGRLAGWVTAASPLLIGFTGVAPIETIAGVLLLAALLLSAAWIRTPRPGRALGVGLAWGVASLAQEFVLPLVLLVAAWAWVPLGLTVLPRDRVRQLVLVVLGLAVVIGPWTLRNATQMRAFVPISTGAGLDLIGADNARAWSDPALRGGAIEASAVTPPLPTDLAEPARDAVAKRLALDFATARGSEWPAVALARLAHLLQPIDRGDAADPARPPGPLFPGVPRVLDPLLLSSLLLLPLAFWGAARALAGERRWYQSLALLPLLHVAIVAVGVYGAQRRRVPIEPLVALLAAAGFEHLRRRVRGRAHGLHVIRSDRFGTAEK